MNPIDQQLLKACKNGDFQTAEKLLQQGANPNAKDNFGRTLITIAIQYGYLKIINTLIQYGANPHTTDYQGQTALHHALENQKHDIARYLITELKLNPNRKDQRGRTPLMLASAKGDIKILQLLIQNGANPHATDHDDRTALHYAVKNKNYDIAQYLLTQLQVAPNTQDRRGYTPFLIAAQNGDIDMLQLLVQNGANPHTTDHDGQTALHHAVENLRYEAAEYLITQLKLDPNTQDQWGRTPLIITTEKGDFDILKLLAQHGANPHIANKYKQTALHYAVKNKNYDIAQYLLTQLQVDPNTKDQLGYTPFLLATQNGDIHMLQLLAQHGADLHATDHDGRTALHYALENLNRDIAQYLITELQLDPNRKDQWGRTPLMLASANGDIKILHILAQHGADPHIIDRDSRTALHYAVENLRDEATEYLLTQLKLDLNTQDRWGRTPFIIATEKGDIDILQLLTQHGANPHITDHQGRNALHYAVKNKNYDIAQYLITQLHINPNTQDNNGITPFMIATQNGDIEMLRLLIRHGANPHTTDNNGRSALHYALEKQYHDIAQYLLAQLKLDPNTQDQWGRTPFLIAVQNNDVNIIKFLIQHGADPYIWNTWGKSALHYALENKRRDIAQYLLIQLQLDPNTQNRRGATPFMIAAENGDIKMLRLLIQLGANPYAADKDGRNALHYAVEYGNPKAVSFLITDLHLDPNTPDHQGITPLLLALQNGHYDTAKTLTRFGAHPHIPNHQGETAAAIVHQRRIPIEKPQPSTITL